MSNNPEVPFPNLIGSICDAFGVSDENCQIDDGLSNFNGDRELTVMVMIDGMRVCVGVSHVNLKGLSHHRSDFNGKGFKA